MVTFLPLRVTRHMPGLSLAFILPLSYLPLFPLDCALCFPALSCKSMQIKSGTLPCEVLGCKKLGTHASHKGKVVFVYLCGANCCPKI
ncbi:hypothetical protein DFH07DRAFT_834903, partial [Mycena maculata]